MEEFAEEGDEEEYNRFKDDEVVGDDEEQPLFKAHFILVEHKVDKVLKEGAIAQQKQYFERLHLVRTVNKVKKGGVVEQNFHVVG